ncbi:ABC transporter ATP-binding protein [Phytohabitans rumicis]|uniref:Dipeptide/oligopeptide/nickel ABC transporter ATP-binding protein n=1 Tax=Phytohabitans rumicis TaxID=1076125 RepID=A0A6V8LAT2_9ACTN|nr:ABC transporter ATP-binding protein [Phytohabitans rumicis]GFJ91649.1 dipeptide/oligopeptide/nickel ABC transporter ATP-binding protein [Phytohabitans rumicis]
MEPILSVRDLVVEYATSAGPVRAVRGVSFDLFPNESLAIVGESGCGKTTLGLALLRLLPKLGSTPAGEVRYRRRDGTVVDLLTLDKEQLRRFRWSEAAMVFQGAMNSLNPVLRVRDQMRDTIRAHRRRMSTEDIRRRCEDALRKVRLDPQRVLSAYPHELSGGMKQRVLIAMSLLLDPQILVLDEPTTALDILTQRAIVNVLHGLREELGFAMIFVSHDLPLAAELADRVATMYAGRVIELGGVRDIFYQPRHPYTVGLLKAVPPVVGDLPELASIPGGPPSLLNLPPGCPFHPRCEYARRDCTETDPELASVGVRHETACHHSDQVTFERKVVASGG